MHQGALLLYKLINYYIYNCPRVPCTVIFVVQFHFSKWKVGVYTSASSYVLDKFFSAAPL